MLIAGLGHRVSVPWFPFQLDLGGRAHFSVAAGDYVNHAIAVGADQDNTTPVYGVDTDAAEQAIFGRVMHGISVDGVTQQATIDDYAETLLASLSDVHFRPTNQPAFPVAGAQVDDFEAGDKITWNYDYGLGNFSVARDVSKKWVKVHPTGQEEMTVEFL